MSKNTKLKKRIFELAINGNFEKVKKELTIIAGRNQISYKLEMDKGTTCEVIF